MVLKLNLVANPDFPEVGTQTPKMGTLTYYFGKFFPENCIKMKKRVGLSLVSATLDLPHILVMSKRNVKVKLALIFIPHLRPSFETFS